MDSLKIMRLEAMSKYLVPDTTVLDIGCNVGHIVDFGPKCHYHGVDVSPDMVAKAKEHMEAQVAMAEELPFGDNEFHSSLLGEILEHVHSAEDVVKEAVRVTKHRLIGSTPHEKGNWGPHGMHKPEKHHFHVRCFTETSLRGLLSPYGQVEVETLVHKKKPQIYVFVVDLAQ